MIQDLSNALKNAKGLVDLHEAAKNAADYLDSIARLEGALKNLYRVASDSLIHDQLDDSAKGHRIGTIEVCEAILKIF